MKFTNFKNRLKNLESKLSVGSIRLFMRDGSARTIPGSGQFMLELVIDNMLAQNAKIMGKEDPPRRHPIEADWVRDCVACDGPPELIQLAKSFAKGPKL